jgi:hypothetical protein
MLICMRTTLNINDDLMRATKRRAAETGRTVSGMIEVALREILEKENRKDNGDNRYRLQWVVVEGGVQPGVDLTDRDSLYDHME